MFEMNKEYEYRDICKMLEWKIQTGNNETKQKQIKIIESSFEWYHPENKKTHRPKKSYVFTKQLKEPIWEDGRKNNGAVGLFSEEKFDYLLNCLLSAGVKRNVYFQRGMCNDIYLSNSLIYKEFGFDIYGTLNQITWNLKDKEVKRLFKSICIDSIKSNTITRICKKFGYDRNSLPKGILRQEGCRGKSADRLIPDNDLLVKYNEYEQAFAEGFGYKTVRDAYDNGLFFEIKKCIDGKFAEEKLYGVKKYNVISIEGEMHFVANRKTKAIYQAELKEIVINSIEKSVKRRIAGVKKYKYELDNWQKKLMENYLNQLLGKENDTIEDELEDEFDWLEAI